MPKFTSVHVPRVGVVRRTLLTVGTVALLTAGVSLPVTVAGAVTALPSIGNIPSAPVYGGAFTPSVTSVTSGPRR